jgi:hypothetical protein
MLLLLSSSARPRYHDDIVRVLAHPEGTDFHFRYGFPYVADDVINDAKVGQLSGEKALVCYLADRYGSVAALVPCRFVTVIKAQVIGTSIVITLRADGFVTHLDDNSLRKLMKPDEVVLLPNQGSDAERPPGKFAFRIETLLQGISASVGDAMSAFEATTKALRQAGFGGRRPTPFYSVRDIEEVVDTGNRAKSISAAKGRFQLRSGQRYLVEVYSYAPESDEKLSDSDSLQVRSEAPEIRFSSDWKAKLDSRYDLNRFVFSTEHKLFALPATLRFSLHSEGVVGDAKTEERCDITLELLFKGSLNLAIARVALIAIGTASPAIVGAYVAGKGSLGVAVIMFAFAFFTGVGTIFPALRKV